MDYLKVWAYLFLKPSVDLFIQDKYFIMLVIYSIGAVLMNLEMYRSLVREVIYVRMVRDRCIDFYANGRL